MTTRRTSLALALAIALTTAPAARAAGTSTCIDAAERGQALRDKGQLRDAREQLLACAADTCPGVIRSDCQRWLADVDERMPAVLVRARSAHGDDLVDVRVLVDGEAILTRLEGRYVPVDPGPHTFRFEHAGDAPFEEQVVVNEREKTRVLDVTFAATSPAPKPLASSPADREPSPSSGGKPIPAASLVLAGIGVVGLAGFAYFGVKTNHDLDALRTSCAPGCTDSEVAPARREMIAANVSIGVAVVALAAAAVVWITSSPSRPAMTTTARR